MQKTTQIFKCRGPEQILKERLKELESNSEFDYIRYSDFYTKICKNFSVQKTVAKEFLFYLKELNLIAMGKRGFVLNY